jgi:catechol 2,3-dioxygenase-like lactoylglutathione lyase family enzyme
VRSHGAKGVLRPERLTVKINHLDLQVSDVPRTVSLFEELLGLRCESNRRSPAIAILSDGEGFTLVLQRRGESDAPYPEGFHFGFLVSHVATVEGLQAKARALGLDVSDVLDTNRGILCYWRTGDGFMVEVSCHRARRAGTG